MSQQVDIQQYIKPKFNLTVEGKTVVQLIQQNLKRSHELFLANHDEQPKLDEQSQRAKIACKIKDEYESVMEKYKQPDAQQSIKQKQQDQSLEQVQAKSQNIKGTSLVESSNNINTESKSSTAKIIRSIPKSSVQQNMESNQKQLALYSESKSKAIVPSSHGKDKAYVPSAQIAKRLASKWPKPVWHPPWKLYRVISGHLGWVRSVAFDSSNEWFATGSADRTIKFWETATGNLKLTLTGHIEQITGIQVSPRHPYLFSCGLDKKVLCWDLEQNKVIRAYHGHLSGVYSLKLHPEIDVLMSGGRDQVCRVWDMRTKTQIYCLSGHHDTVTTIAAQSVDPQIITGSSDHNVKMWDIRTGKSTCTLTMHKKSVRALVKHPRESSFASASPDNIKKFMLPDGNFLHNFLQHQGAIINSLDVNEDGVMASGGDNGSLWFRDWKSGNSFQQEHTIVQPGSLDSECGIFACKFDQTGTRFVTCEADKTIKMWKEDLNATPETHPIIFRPPSDRKRY